MATQEGNTNMGESNAQSILSAVGYWTTRRLRYHGVTTSHMAFMLDHPTAEVIEFTECDFNLLTAIPVNKHSHIHTVELKRTIIDDTGFDELLSNLPSLRKITYTRPTESGWAPFDLIGDVIRAKGQKLQHLVFLNNSDLPFDFPLGSFKECVELRSLEIDLDLLIGYLPAPETLTQEGFDEIYQAQRIDWSLVDLLPFNIQKLIIHIPEEKFNTPLYAVYERYAAKLEELLVSEERFPHLQCVTAPGIEDVVRNMGDRTPRWFSNLRGTVFRAPITIDAILSGVDGVHISDDDLATLTFTEENLPTVAEYSDFAIRNERNRARLALFDDGPFEDDSSSSDDDNVDTSMLDVSQLSQEE